MVRCRWSHPYRRQTATSGCAPIWTLSSRSPPAQWTCCRSTVSRGGRLRRIFGLRRSEQALKSSPPNCDSPAATAPQEQLLSTQSGPTAGGSASVNVRLDTRSLVGLGPSQGRAMPLPSWQASRCIRTRRQSSGPPQRRTDCFVSSRLAMPRVVRAERPPGQDRHFRRQPLRRTKRASRRCRRRSFPPPFPRS